MRFTCPNQSLSPAPPLDALRFTPRSPRSSYSSCSPFGTPESSPECYNSRTVFNYFSIELMWRASTREEVMKPRFTLSWLLVLVAALGFMAFAQSRHALTFDDLAAIKRIGDAQISPTGERVAYVVNAIDKEQNRGKRSIWVVSTAGG